MGQFGDFRQLTRYITKTVRPTRSGSLKREFPTVSKQTVIKRLPNKLALSDLSDLEDVVTKGRRGEGAVVPGAAGEGAQKSLT